MKVKQKGLSENSTMEMLLPSSLARETLYYVIGWGRFFCSTEYFVERSRMTSNILVFVVSGRIKLRAYGANRFAGAGQVIMIGADAPHTVWCREDAELLWIRCKGVTMDSYMRFLLNRSASPVFDTEDPEKILAEIRRLYPGAATEEIGSMEFRAAEIPPEAFDREDAYAMTDRKPDYRDVPPEPLDDGDRKALKQEVHKAGWDELQPEKQATQDKEPEAGDVEEDYSQELKAPFPLR